MSKTNLSEINGFTPLLDVLVERYGMMTAAVFGMMWRYYQMKDGVCRASLEKIACRLNIDRRSVIRHIRILVSSGLLQDTTPNLRNQPHIYADTGKVSTLSQMGMLKMGVPESDCTASERYSSVPERNSESQTGVPESHSKSLISVPKSHSTVTLSYSHSDRESLKDSIKTPKKRGTGTGTTTAASRTILKFFEEEIGPRTPYITQQIQSYLNKPACPPE
jgi:hypothetical protein